MISFWLYKVKIGVLLLELLPNPGTAMNSWFLANKRDPGPVNPQLHEPSLFSQRISLRSKYK